MPIHPAMPPLEDEVPRLLHITDCHLRADPERRLLGIDTAATLAATLRQALSEHAPDAMIISGDLAHDPEPASYARLAALLDDHYRGPRLYLAGNHDVTAAMGGLWSEAPQIRLDDWEVLGFDSHADDAPQAHFDAGRRDALLARIHASTAAHILLTCHHPVLPVGSPWLDRDRIIDGESLLESLAATGRVRGLVFGHVHQALAMAHVGTGAEGEPAGSGELALLATPSTCFQFAPASAHFAIDQSLPGGQPGYRWLVLEDDGNLRTRVGRVMDYPMHFDMSDRS